MNNKITKLKLSFNFGKIRKYDFLKIILLILIFWHLNT